MKRDSIPPAPEGEIAQGARIDPDHPMFAALIEGIPGASCAFRKTPEGRYDIPHTNRRMQTLFDVRPADLVNNADRMLARVHPRDVAGVVAGIEESARTLQVWRSEFSVLTRREGERRVAAEGMPSPGIGGGTLWLMSFTDVTERTRTDTKLQQSRARLLAALDAGGMGTFAWEAARGWIEWDEASQAILGRTEAELQRGSLESALTFVHPDDRESIRSQVTSLSSLAVVNIRFRILRPGGTVRWISVLSRLERDESGRATSVTGVCQDITTQAELELALRESEGGLQTLFRSSPTAKLLVRIADHVVVEANEAFLRIFELRREEFIGRRLEDISQLRSGPGSAEVFQRIATEGRQENVEHTFSHADGSPLFGLISSEPVTIRGERYGLHAIVDNTERRRVVEALRVSETQLRKITENLREVVWLRETTTGRVLYVSPAYETMTGRSCAALYASGADWLAAVHPEDLPAVMAAVATREETGEFDIEYRVSLPDGTSRWIHDRAFAVRDATGQITNLAGIAEDITKSRAADARIRQAQRMESMGQLAGGVAHDFNNLLTVIGASVDVLNDSLPDDELTREALDDIRLASERAASLTRQLLAFTRREVVGLRVLDLNPLVIESEKMLRRVLGEQVMLSTELDLGAGSVKVDPGQWASVLMNLAVNARDAMPEGGRLIIRTRGERLDGAGGTPNPIRPLGDYFVLEVQDTGTGITADIRDQMFEPFFTTKTIDKGTGLGLAVVHGIVQQSGGYIEVDCPPSGGTVFRISLPIVAAAPQPRPKIEARRDAGGTETILVVEDEELIRALAVRLLRNSGYTVLQAADGVEALETLRAMRVPLDLLLTDVVMPRMDGRALALAVNERLPGTRVLYTSGYTDIPALRRGISSADLAFLPKPYTRQGLLERVRAMLDEPLPPS